MLDVGPDGALVRPDEPDARSPGGRPGRPAACSPAARRFCAAGRRAAAARSDVSRAVRYRPLRPGEAAAVSALIRASFDEFIGPDYTDEGIAEFRGFVAPGALEARTGEDHFIRVATVDGALAGMIEMRQNNHVALLFVDKAHQRRGIARGLLRAALADARAAAPDLERVTVNSSRYGVPAYEKLGFRQTGPERAVNGIVFIPMAMQLDADL